MAKKQSTKREGETLLDLDELSAKRSLPAWERAGLMQATGWAPGKQVTEAAFDNALFKFRNRPQGGGRIT